MSIRRGNGGGSPAEIIRVDRAIAPLRDDLAESRAKLDARTRAWVNSDLAGFKPEVLDGLAAQWKLETIRTTR